MKTAIRDTKRKGVTTPYNFTKEEFAEEIRKAEKGPFMSMEELERRMNEWMRKSNLTEKKE